jgi:hypothetical protein
MHIILITVGALLGLYGWFTVFESFEGSKELVLVPLAIFFTAVALLGTAHHIGLNWGWVQYLLDMDMKTYFMWPLVIVTGLAFLVAIFSIFSGEGGSLLTPVYVFCMGCLLFVAAWIVFVIPVFITSNPYLFLGLLVVAVVAGLGVIVGKMKRGDTALNDVIEGICDRVRSHHQYVLDEVLTEEEPEEPKDPKAQEYYKYLKLEYGASNTQIKSSYRERIKKYHPDLHQHNKRNKETAEKVTSQLNEAYSYLMKFNKAA